MDFRIIWKEEVNSTNEALKALIKTGVREPLVLAAEYQTSGKGQFDRTWSSTRGENLLCSFYVPGPIFPAGSAFHVSMIAALAVSGVLKELGVDNQIKWPNDILVGGEKICGILIENTIKDQYVGGSIIGIGLNVNQSKFSVEAATSVSLELAEKYDVADILKRLAQTISCWLEDYMLNPASLGTQYKTCLYGFDSKIQAKIDEKVVDCKIRDVLCDGRLVVEVKGEQRTLLQGDIQLLR